MNPRLAAAYEGRGIIHDRVGNKSAAHADFAAAARLREDRKE